jgi:hypothetical protein
LVFLNEVALRTTAPGEYCLHLLHTHGQIVWRHRFITGSDEDAIRISIAFLRHWIDSICGYELWHGTRYICCENDALVEWPLPLRSNPSGQDDAVTHL